MNWKDLKKQFDALCDEQEALPRKGFAKVFEVLDKIDEAFTLDHAYTDNEENINKALEIKGHTNDKAFCKAFKRNNQIIIEGKNIQETMLIETAKSIPQEPEPAADEWQFCPIRIIADESFMPTIDNIIKSDAETGTGLFSNVTDIQNEDESEDEQLVIEFFGLQCSLTPFLDELKLHNVVGGSGLFNDTFKGQLLSKLKTEVLFIKGHSDMPAKVKNHISDTIRTFDEMPLLGLFFQILILQGLHRWLGCVNINEGDNGYYEVQSLLDWLGKHLISKEISFCYVPYGKADKEQLKPFCNYLLSTEIGQIVQNILFKKSEQIDTNTTGEPQQLHFTRLFTDKERQSLFNGLVSNGYIPKSTNTDYFNFVFGGVKTVDFEPLEWQGKAVLLAYFIDVFFADTDSTNLWEITKKCFTIKGKEPNKNTLKNTVSKYKQNNKNKPKNIDKIDVILSNL